MTAADKFYIYCLERYRFYYHLSGKEVIELFNQYNLATYLTKFYPSLHTTSDQYILDDIEDYIRRQK